ncbi:MAG: response regulator [Acidobacteriota bacterium]
MSARVVMVDDEADLVWTTSRHFRRERPEVDFLGFSDPVEALQAINANPPDLLITDVRMPSINGLEMVMLARERSPEMKILVVSAYGADPVRKLAGGQGSVEFLEKPFDYRQLLDHVDSVLAAEQRFFGEVSLPLFSDLIQIVALSRETGAISVLHGETSGTVWFEGGQLVHCVLGELSGAEAFREILSWQRGEFRMRLGEQAPVRTIEEPIDRLVLDSLTSLDEQSAGLKASPQAGTEEGAAAEAAASEGPQDELAEGPTDDSRVSTPNLLAAGRWQRCVVARQLPPACWLLAVSTIDGSSSVLHGEGSAAEGFGDWALDLVHAAAQVDPEARSGSLEGVEPDLGWVLGWDLDQSLAVVFAQRAGGPTGLLSFRANGAAVRQALLEV